MQTRLVATLAPLIAVVALVAGCAGPADSGEATALVEASAETTQGQTSAHLELAVEGGVPGLPVQSISADLTRTPAVAAQGSLDMTYLGQPLVGVEFVIFDGELWVAITSGSELSSFGPASEVYDASVILDPDLGLANLLASFGDGASDGTENVGGVDTARVTGTISAEAVNQLIPGFGASDPVPCTVWIAEGGDNELVQLRLEPSEGNSVTMTLSQWGEAFTIDDPAA